MNQASHTIDSFIRERTGKLADQPAFTCMGQTLSYEQIEARSNELAAWFRYESGLQAGDRVAVQLPNILQYPVTALAIIKAGLVLVNVNPLYTPAELLRLLQASGARALVVLANMAQGAAGIVSQTVVSRVVVTELGDLHSFPQRQLLNWLVKYIKKLVPAYAFTDAISFRDALKCGARQLALQGLQDAGVRADSLALLQYTGGTTGVAKAAMLTHDNLVSNILQLGARFADCYPPPGAVMVAPLPLYHIYAFSLSFLSGMAHGHHSILIPNPRDVTALVKALRPFRVNGFLGINTLYRMLCEHEEFCRLDFSGLQIASAGGMALAPAVAEKWEALTGCPIVEGYGLSECSPLLVCNTGTERRPGTVGKPVPQTRLKLVDASGREVAVGEPGEICVKGPQVMQGYWQNAEENARAFDMDGWFHTGDVGVLDAQGYLTIVDRIKDVIIVSGFNVYPVEIEDYACTHPHVLEACAIGVGDEYSVQIKLVVVSSNSQLQADDIILWCRQGLAAYKVPRQIELRSSLPKSNVGKVLRKVLRDEANAALNGAVNGKNTRQ